MARTSPRNDTADDGIDDRTSEAFEVRRVTDWVAPRAEKVSEVVARSIVQDIASRELQPGTMLPPESVMLERYRVGRASLREGLRILEIQGLITIKPGPGG